VEKHPAFEIEPLQGSIPFDRDSFIRVTFSPKEFCTAMMKIKIHISQFNSDPVLSVFYGLSKPGLARDEESNQLYSNKNEINTHRFGNNEFYIDTQNFKKEKIEKKNSNLRKTDSIQKLNYIEYEGYRFPLNLNNPWNISKVLNQTKNKLSLKEMKSSVQKSRVTAQEKEKNFLQKVKELEDEERKNKLKWQVKLGESMIDEKISEEILTYRNKAMDEYKQFTGQPSLEEIDRKKTATSVCRTFRFYKTICKANINFDIYKNSLWLIKYGALERMIQAVRRIIIMNRIKKNLRSIKMFIKEWLGALSERMDDQNKDTIHFTLCDYIEKYQLQTMNKSKNNNDKMSLTINNNYIGNFYFKKIIEMKEYGYENSSHCKKIKSILCLNSLGNVAVKKNIFNTEKTIPYARLASAMTFKINNYKLTNRDIYQPIYNKRIEKLRHGAEDELLQVDTSLDAENDIGLINCKNEHKDSQYTKSLNLTEVLATANRIMIQDFHPSNELKQLEKYNNMQIYVSTFVFFHSKSISVNK
jgi:hypothetical protein